MLDIVLKLTRLMTDLGLEIARIALCGDWPQSAAGAVERPNASSHIEQKNRSTTLIDATESRSKDQRPTMYTLSKAKEEIDAIAQYAVSLADHALAAGDDLNGKLETFKQEIVAHIDAKFAELQKAIVGDQAPSESSAVGDLAAKVALLRRDPTPEEQHDHGHDQGHHDQGWHGDQHHG